MALLNPLAPVTGLVGSVVNAVKPAHKPVQGQSFDQILSDNMRMSSDPGVMRMQASKARAAADAAAKKFLGQHDSNNDQLLTRDESGMDAQAFQRLDLNRDGRLTLDELKKPSLDRIAAMYPDTVNHA